MDCLYAVDASLSRVKNLAPGSEPAGTHSSESAGACEDKFPLRPVLGRLHPNGVAVGVIEDHLVPVASAGCEWEFSSLVGVDCVMGVVRLDIDVLMLVGGGSE